MAKPLRVALAGLGAAARQVAPGFWEVPGIEFTAVADLYEEEVKAHDTAGG